MENENHDPNMMIQEQPVMGAQPTTITPVLPQKSNKSILKLFLVLLLLILLSISLVGLWLINTKNSISNVPINNTVQVAAPKPLYFQMKNSIWAFDPTTKKSSVITDKVPNGSTVLDFYRYSDIEWRYYSYVQGKNTLYFADQSNAPVSVSDLMNSSFQVANAKMRIYAYTINPIGNANGVTQTYISKGNAKPELVYQSSASTAARSTDLSSSRYVLSDISPDGKTLLFQQVFCFNCDGGLNANLFSLNIDTKATKLINTASDQSTYAKFDEKASVIITSGQFNYAWNEAAPINLKSYQIVDGKSSVIFQSDNKMESYLLSKNGDYALSRLLPADSSSTSRPLMGSLYTIKNGQATAQKTDFGKYAAIDEYNMGSSSGGCVSATFYIRDFAVDQKSADYTYSGGAFCKNSNGNYAYNEVNFVKVNYANTVTYDITHYILNPM